MPATRFDAFDRAAQNAHAWLREVAQRFGTDDRRFAYRALRVAYRALRAWLHTLRDRLTVEAGADFAAGLPELLRGVYYEGWQPATVPTKYGVDEFRLRFKIASGIPIDRVDETASTVTAAVGARLAPGQLNQALAQLPHPRRTILQRPAGPGALVARTRGG